MFWGFLVFRLLFFFSFTVNAFPFSGSSAPLFLGTPSLPDSGHQFKPQHPEQTTKALMAFPEKDSSLSSDIFLKWVRNSRGRTKETQGKVI